MQTKITTEKTFWVSMTAEQLAVLRFAMGGVILSKETDLPLAESVARHAGVQVTDKAFMWETVEAFEAALKELAEGPQK